MLFYKIDAILTENTSENESDSCRLFDLAKAGEDFFKACNEGVYIFACDKEDKRMTFGAIRSDAGSIEQAFLKYMQFAHLKLSEPSFEEITFKALITLLGNAERNDYISDEKDVLDAFDIKDISRYNRFEHTEAMLPEKVDRESLFALSKSLLPGDTLTPELERIYMGKKKANVKGHPVHYVLEAGDRDIQKSIYRTLLEALYANGRIESRRYCIVEHDSAVDDRIYGSLYRICENGALVINVDLDKEDRDPFNDTSDKQPLKALLETASKYKNRVLTVICLSCFDKREAEDFLSMAGDIPFVRLYENKVSRHKAEAYLKSKAAECGLRADKTLLSSFGDEKDGPTVTQLNSAFDGWYDKKLRSSVYPQYKTAVAVKEEKPAETKKESAHARLQRLIGLKTAKKTIDKVLNFYKAQKIFESKGISQERPSMHMVFTGNPGTAKTTVARLFAEIMKENGLLPSGEIHEVGRSDLVGRFVGHTAPLVKQAFQKAKGGVLFIDEAYSLVDGKEGLFGDEAINTIVQEMENHRDDTIVIFAGYPDKMERFLSKNPGLRSRVAFHIPFEDYSANELCEIALLIAEENGLCLSKEAGDELMPIFESARRSDDFGNGRFARNIIEKAKMALAERILTADTDSLSDEDLRTILAEDIPTDHIFSYRSNNPIGFC
ncbi:MAG: AAA family ATPase [Clostridia bacterium]|nr:AAA family ATPase [Clostridia bacterium]